MTRHCGDCGLCCRLLPVPELHKPDGTKCAYLTRKGCRIYHKPGFPRACGSWSCRWLVDPETTALRRPDRTHYVVDIVPDGVVVVDNESGAERLIVVIQVWCDPAWPEAWRDPALLDYAEKKQQPLLIRYSCAHAISAWPPCFSEKGEWQFGQGITLPTRTGNMLLDHVAAGGAR